MKFLKIIVMLVLLGSFLACKKDKNTIDQEGMIGPAGNDGSMLYAGQGEPGVNKGQTGDYYFDTATGNLYGPKISKNWGSPFGMSAANANLASNLLSGDVEPKPADGVVGDFHLNKKTYVLYGPKKAEGWGVGLELKGKKGMQGVKTFISLSTQSFVGPVFYDLPGVNEEMLNKSYVGVSWKREQLLVNPGFYRLYPLPYTFEVGINNAKHMATLYHYVVRGG